MTEKYIKLEKLANEYITNIYSDKTVIKVQTGTSGQAVGSDEIFSRLSSKNNENINVIKVGSMGFMYLEPIIVVVLPVPGPPVMTIFFCIGQK